jgi:DNA mismatch endonuclease (patch repair protein)
MDVHTRIQRSFNMSRIKGKNTQPEEIIRKLLWSNGYRYRLHEKNLPGKPDIVFLGKKKVILVNGCFWHMHGCSYFKWPKTNSKFWRKKISDNAVRDKKNYKSLSAGGWHYLVIWECETKAKSPERLWRKIDRFLTS